MKRPCPVCGSVGTRRILHRQRFLNGPLGKGYDVVVCRKCGAGFADGIPKQSELDRYYADQSRYEYAQRAGEESPYDFKRFEAIADQVIPLLKSHAVRILDVGCATGGLLSVFKKRGFANVLGLDPSPACAEAARRLHGVEVRKGTLAQLAGWRERFDLVLVIGVLEHLSDVQPAVLAIASRLSDDGFFYCAQPDVRAFAECVNAPYQQFSVEHLNFFSTSSLRRLMGECGLVQRRIWRWMLEWREGVTDSVLSGIYSVSNPVKLSKAKSHFTTTCVSRRQSQRRAGKAFSDGLAPILGGPDRQTEVSLRNYIRKCETRDKVVLKKVEDLVRGQKPILVWGAGTLTRRLLWSTRLREANIVAFVDSNRGLQGRSLAGRTIISPAQLTARNETIVVCSKAFEREIVETIRDQLALDNPLILIG